MKIEEPHARLFAPPTRRTARLISNTAVNYPELFIDAIHKLENAMNEPVWDWKMESLFAWYLEDRDAFLAATERTLSTANNPISAMVWRAEQLGYKEAKVALTFTVRHPQTRG